MNIQDTFSHLVLDGILRQKRLQPVIKCLWRLLPSEEDMVSLTLHRGQQMTVFEIDKLKNNMGEIVSISHFFLITMSGKIVSIFAGDGSNDNPYLVSVKFKIYIDTGQPARSYALINNSGEEAVFFSPGTKFLLMSCQKLHDNGRVWLIELKAIPEKQQEQFELGETFLLLNAASGWPETGRGCSVSNHLTNETLEQGRNRFRLSTNPVVSDIIL